MTRPSFLSLLIFTIMMLPLAAQAIAEEPRVKDVLEEVDEGQDAASEVPPAVGSGGLIRPRYTDQYFYRFIDNPGGSGLRKRGRNTWTLGIERRLLTAQVALSWPGKSR